MPPIQNPARRRKAKSDFRYFCEVYFPKKFRKRWGKHHLKYIERLENLFLHGGKQAIAMPRGAGKTTLAFAAVMWALLFGRSKMMLVVSKNKIEARKLIQSIRSALQKNELLFADFPEVCYAMQRLGRSAHQAPGQLYLGCHTDIVLTADEIRFPTIAGNKSSGATVVATGIGAAIRGKFTEGPNGETVRPDFVLIDDLQTDKAAKSPEQVAELEELIGTALEGLSEDGKRISMLMTCTVMRPGDLADRYLNHKLHPHWHGLRFRMLETMPTKMEMWDTYRQLRQDSVRRANEYYYANQTAMDEGAVATSIDSYDDRFEINAIHHAMNFWADNEESFWREKQNEPQEELAGDSIVNAETILTRLNGYEQGIVPNGVTTITAYVDVHDDILYWSVIGWKPGFTGYVLDYGTYPKQKSKYFGKRDRSNQTLRNMYPSKDVNSRIEEGLNDLLQQLLHNQFEREEGGSACVNQLLVDRGFKPGQVENAILKLSKTDIIKVDPSVGRGFKAANCPIASLTGDYIEERGTHWYRGKLEEDWKLEYYTIDTNFWKASIHEALSNDVNTPGNLSLWGKDPERHRMIADHCTIERAELAKANGREIYEFDSDPNMNNHFFDCFTGCKAGASIYGIRK